MSSRLICLLGIGVFVGLAWSISTHRRRFPFRVVVGGIGLQIALAMLILRTDLGRSFFRSLGDAFTSVLGCVRSGSGFVFETAASRGTDFNLLETFAFGVLPTVIFFSALMSVLYHIGVMPRLVAGLAWVMRYTLGTSGPETLAAAANVFVGHTEAPLVVRPYLATMSRSELCAMMTGGFATVTGGLLGVYAGYGIDVAHLLTASVISAPAALLVAKVMVPETPIACESGACDSSAGALPGPETPGLGTGLGESVNLIGAAVDGASQGLKLALNVGAMLIAFLALLAVADLALLNTCRWTGELVHRLGLRASADVPVVTLRGVVGYLACPLAWLMGIPAGECVEAGRLIGIKTVANELVAFSDLQAAVKSGHSTLSPRTIAVLTYALAGFSNFGAIGIQVGGLGGLAPTRRRELAELGLRAMIGGTLACCITGAVAGLML